MLDQFLWTISSPLLGAGGGWFSTNWQALVDAVMEKRFFDILINPYIVILSIAVVVFALVVKSKKLLMVVIAMWGYGITFHFTIEEKNAGDVMFDYNTMQTSELGPLVLFFIGFIIVTAIILYLGFIKGD
jgi:hypothetical protein